MRSIEVNGTTLAYQEAGTGPLALFVHGFPLDHRQWLDQLSDLGDLRRCVAVDLRGCGQSATTRMRPLGMEVLADDAAALIDRLGEGQADVVGLSMGGYVALALWERQPWLVRSLALLDTQAADDDDDRRRRRQEMADSVILEGREWLGRQLSSRLLGARASLDTRARLRSMIEAMPYETILAQLDGMAARADRTEVLASITVPTLVLVGEEDSLTPPATAAEMADQIHECRLVVVPGAGHLTPLESPEAVNLALRELWQ